MSEIIEQSQSNTYIQVSIDDNINEQDNKISYNDDFINSIPDTNAFLTISNSIATFFNVFGNLKVLKFSIFGLGELFIQQDRNDPLKLSITLFNIATSAVMDTISLVAVYATNGKKVFNALSKENLITFLTLNAVEELVDTAVTYECISSLYKLKYESEIKKAKEKEYLTINASGQSIQEIKNFLYYTGVLQESDIKRIYVQTNDGIYRVLKPDSDEFVAIENELKRRGYSSLDTSSDFNTLMTLNEIETDSTETRQNITEYCAENMFTYKNKNYILLKNDLFTYPMIGNSQDNIIYADNEARTLYGSGGNDLIQAGDNNDVLYGDSSKYFPGAINIGNDILLGGYGNDKIYGEKGDDVLIGDKCIYTENELKQLINQKNSIIDNDFEFENDGNDYLDGGEGEDLLIGGGGNDILVGGKDEDTLYGGSGKDLLIAGDTLKTQEELQNILNNNASFSVSDFETDSSENTLHGGTGDDIIIGDKGDDTMYGDADNDVLFGGDGNDEIYGDDENNVYTGNDVLIGGNGNDELHGGNGNDVIIAGNTSLSVDSLKNLSAIQNSINASAYQSQNGGENKLYGNAGNDILIGDKGDDILDGGSDADYMYGGDGNDTYIFDDDSNMNTDNVIEKANEGDSDTIDFSNVSSAVDVDLTQNSGKVFANNSDVSGIENIYGTNSNDKITGQNLNNVLVGNEGNDTLS